MMRYKNTKIIFFVAVFSVFLAFTESVFSQDSQAEMAQLMITGKSAGGKSPFINVNGGNSINGSNLISPSQISVPVDTSASISFGKSGKIDLSPGTNITLTFTDAGVSVDLTEGRLLLTCAPNANFNIGTRDGIIANEKTRNAVFIIEIVGGSTGVITEAGIATVNGVPVKAGEVWTADPAKKAAFVRSVKGDKSSRKSKLLLLGAGAAIGAGVIIVVNAVRRN